VGEDPAARLDKPVFVAVIGLSAFLLFTLELLAGRLVLPVFGGSPAVWTTALCFFTGVVFLGYLYAHVVATRLGPRSGGIVHLALAAAAVAAAVYMPVNLATLRFASMPAAVNVLLVLTLIAGAPAFLLSTTTPLLSSWFSKRGGDPWWLYAVSNGASLLGLMAYPFVIEPTIPLSAQRTLLAAMLALLAGGIAVVVATGRRAVMATDWSMHAQQPPGGGELAVILASPRPTRRRQALWLFAACVPAGLLSATTTHIATDQVSTPLLWIGPLAIYLGSFVIAFSERGRRLLPAVERLVPAAATLMWVPYVVRGSWPAGVLIPLLLSSFAVLATALHGRLALDRPCESYLTRFYLVVSAGGLVATALVALVAPIVFNDVYEYPVLLIAGLVALAVLPGPASPSVGLAPGTALRGLGTRLAPYATVGLALVALLAPGSRDFALAVGTSLIVGAAAIAVGRSPRSLVLGTTVAVVLLMSIFYSSPLTKVRTFFGVTQVRQAYNGAAHVESHGTTLHGLQFLDARRTAPTSYYTDSGPLGDVVRDFRQRLPQGGSIGVVGLGVGTAAAYVRPSDSMTFFEIDQAVVDLARNARYFTYLADAPHQPEVILGDGRLSLVVAPEGSFDLLVLDAFSSDTVPAHLLTREAMVIYHRALRPHGIIVFHLTNRHFDLVPAVASTAESIGFDARVRSFTPDIAERAEVAAYPSVWLAVGNADDVVRFEAQTWSRPARGPVLTDDFSDIMWLLRPR